MKMSDIVQVISTVGFPIGMCLLMGWFIVSILNKYENQINLLRDTIQENTIVLNKMITTIELLHKEEKDNNE